MNRACFLDRDGVLIVDMDYLKNPEKVELIPGAVEALKMVKDAGYMVVVVSNQSGVARGIFEEKDVIAVNNRINEILRDKGVTIDAFYYCPHHPKGIIEKYSFACDCRKPEPAMLINASREYSIDLSSSFMVGDKISDLQVAHNAGCDMGIIVRTGHGEEQIAGKDTSGIPICNDINDAIEWYLGNRR